MSRKRVYMVLVIVGAASAITGILMRRSGGPLLQNIANLLGWGGIAMMLAARIVFGRRRPQRASDQGDR